MTCNRIVVWFLDLVGERFEEWTRVGHCQTDVECRRGWRTPFGVVWFDPDRRTAR